LHGDDGNDLQGAVEQSRHAGIGHQGAVVEGWHGVPFGKPMARTREYIEILRKI